MDSWEKDENKTFIIKEMKNVTLHSSSYLSTIFFTNLLLDLWDLHVGLTNLMVNLSVHYVEMVKNEKENKFYHFSKESYL